MRKIAIVVPYLKINNEKDNIFEILKSYKGITNILSRYGEDIFINIITTTATCKRTKWMNETTPGYSYGNNFQIIRFDIDSEYYSSLRDGNTYEIKNSVTAMREYAYCCEYGPVSKELFNYVRLHYNRYNAVLFWGLEYYTTSIVVCGIENAILIPSLTRNGKKLLEVGFFKKVFENVLVIANSQEEKNIIAKNVKCAKVVCENEILEEDIFPFSNIHEDFIVDGIIENGIKPAFLENNVGVVLASDERYVPFLCVAIKSIVDCASDENNYDIIVLSDGISNVTRCKIQKMANSRNVKVRFVEISYLLNNYNFSFRCQQLSRCAFGRMLLPDLLADYEKVLYLDCDILAIKDISELYYKNIEGYYLAAVKDRFVSIIREGQIEENNHIKHNVKLDDKQDYFNSGVLLINLEEFRKNYKISDMMDLAELRTWMWEDQDVLNYLCKERVKWIEPKWNMLWGLDTQLRDMMLMEMEYFRAFNDPSIIHYAGGCLPTKTLDDIYSVEFWEVAKKTPFYEKLILLSLQNEVHTIVDHSIMVNNQKMQSEKYREKFISQNKRKEKILGKKIRSFIKKIIVKFVAPIFRDSYLEQKQFQDKSIQLLELIERTSNK